MAASLADSIRRAHSQNEARVAAEVATPKSELDTEAQLHIQHFAEFCISRALPGLPARPATCAMFVRVQNGSGVPAERIISALTAIEAIHSDHNLANPIATPAVRTELARILKIDGEPRSWSKSERLVFAGLSPEVQAIVMRRAKQGSDLIRKLQNENSELRKSINSNKESENHAS